MLRGIWGLSLLEGTPNFGGLKRTPKGKPRLASFLLLFFWGGVP